MIRMEISSSFSRIQKKLQLLSRLATRRMRAPLPKYHLWRRSLQKRYAYWCLLNICHSSHQYLKQCSIIFKEGHDLAKGTAEVPLPDDDPTAFQILLDIIHHRYRRVPKKLDLDTVAEIAILVDKYQVHEYVIMSSLT